MLDVRNTACMMSDVQLLLGENDKLIVDEVLKLNASDKLCGDDLVGKVVHYTEYVDVLTADVDEVGR